MRILGISAYYHDSAAALVDDGNVVAAAQEERFSRKKHDPGFPKSAVEYCLRQAGIDLTDVTHIAFYDKPFLKFERLLETYLSFAPLGFRSFAMAMPVWIREKLFQKILLADELSNFGITKKEAMAKLLFAEHHMSHAASAFYPSPFDRAAVLTMDGVGEWATTTVGVGNGKDLSILEEIRFPHSLGLLYSAFTYYTGFKVNSGEYKVMGLAPYGTPKYAQTILDNLIDVRPDGSFRLNMRYFNYCTGLTMTSAAFDELFGGPSRSPETLLTQRDMDLAASIQSVTEEVVLRMGRDIAHRTGEHNLCLAGGVALNCVANGKLLREGVFDDIWIQPAAGDAGGALGAALAAHYDHHGGARPARNDLDGMSGSFLGPDYSQTEMEERLQAVGARFDVVDDDRLIAEIADALAAGAGVGWFQGRMEFGPRALGSRSILGDPRAADMQKRLNIKVKFRESFRPFAPSVLADRASDYFEIDRPSPYMLLVADVVKSRRRAMTDDDSALWGIDKLNVARSDIPAVTHVDYSARIQTVHAETNPRYHALLRAFAERTGCPVLINTSFNVRGEPIVCTPEDAFRCFMGADLDFLAVGNCVLQKSAQDPALHEAYYGKFELD